METASLVRVDVTHYGGDPVPFDDVARRYTVHHSPGHDVQDAVMAADPCLIVFEFDYPDLTSLSLLRTTKARFPQIPIVMLTREHSESLVVWALRLRVWDLLITPVAGEVLVRSVAAAHRLGLARRWQHARPGVFPVNSVPSEARFRKASDGSDELETVVRYVEQCIRQRRTPVQANAAELMNMRSSAFSRFFRQRTDGTFRDFVMALRLDEAKRILSRDDGSVAEACCAAGFNDVSHFSRIFRQRTGDTPAGFRRKRCPPSRSDQ